MADDKLNELARSLEELNRRRTEHRLARYEPYAKQREFHALGAQHRERMFMAGNQLGKTWAGAMEMAAHLTGEYPEWWEGRRHNEPVRAWCAGVTGESTRDNPQRLLLGSLGHQGTGSIPKAAIHDVRVGRGLPDAVDTVLVKHKSGGLSQISFKSYEKGREKWQGETLDEIWLDEEPPVDIYSEALARIAARAGNIYLTATPLLGMSDVVRRFMSDPSPDRAYVQMSIADALHIPPDERQRIIDGYPAHEREARVNGTPMLGSGRVFPIPESSIIEDPFAIPHYWPRICGVDFGWDHPTAAVWLAWDRDADTVHIYDCYRVREATPIIHAAAIKARGDWIPCAWPHDGLQHDKGSGAPLAEIYRLQGVKMLEDHAEFSEGGRSVEAGVLDMFDRMQTSRLKIFSHLGDWLEEFRVYHRKDGRIVAKGDDLMAATRYAHMMLRHACIETSGTRHRPRIAEGVGDEPFGPNEPPQTSHYSNSATMAQDRERRRRGSTRPRVADGVGE